MGIRKRANKYKKWKVMESRKKHNAYIHGGKGKMREKSYYNDV